MTLQLHVLQGLLPTTITYAHTCTCTLYLYSLLFDEILIYVHVHALYPSRLGCTVRVNLLMLVRHGMNCSLMMSFLMIPERMPLRVRVGVVMCRGMV